VEGMSTFKDSTDYEHTIPEPLCVGGESRFVAVRSTRCAVSRTPGGVTKRSGRASWPSCIARSGTWSTHRANPEGRWWIAALPYSGAAVPSGSINFESSSSSASPHHDPESPSSEDGP